MPCLKLLLHKLQKVIEKSSKIKLSAHDIDSFLAWLQLPAHSADKLSNWMAPVHHLRLLISLTLCLMVKPPALAASPMIITNCLNFSITLSWWDVYGYSIYCRLTTGDAESIHCHHFQTRKGSYYPCKFRSISLLNTDIKIYAKLIAGRLLDILPGLIKLDQAGFIKGRQALLLSLDAEKTFIGNNWEYMSRVLEKFGFHGLILLAISALYSCPLCPSLIVQLWCRTFEITNDTCQGCLLSPSIFNPLIKPLAESINSHPQITGFKIGHICHKINPFADKVILLSWPRLCPMSADFYPILVVSPIIKWISLSP